MKFTFSKELLHAVEQIDLKARRPIASLLAGNYPSRHRGAGMQFKEFRNYEAGDDIRHMSWTLTARTGRPTLKIYEEERELNVVALVDTSGSSIFGSGSKRKVDMYAEVVALLGLGAIKNNDNFGALFFNEGPQKYYPPSRSRDQVMASIEFLLAQPLLKRPTDLRPALEYLRKVLKQKTLIIIVSDFLSPAFSKELGALSRKHELVLMQGYDDAERFLSLREVAEVCDPESGEFFILDPDSPEFRKGFTQFYTQLEGDLQKASRECRAEFLPLSVQDDYLQRLVQFFAERRHRVAA